MSKRGSIFDQGKHENPYNESEDNPADPPRRATAAQLATRKLKTAKGARRPPGVTSGITASPNSFAAPPGSTFTFGAENNTANASSTNIFGNSTSQSTQNGTTFGSATSSFPPAQPPTQNNIFSSSSFPAFGSGNTNTTFNPQPPSGTFNFSVGTGNPFAASTPAPVSTSASTPNGSGGGATAAGSIFSTNDTKQNNSADTNSVAQNNTFGAFGGSSTFATGTPFGTSSTPSNTAFGGSSMAPTSTFGTSGGFGTSSATQNNAFGTSSAAQNNVFGTTSASQSSVFGSTGAAHGGLFGASSVSQSNLFGTLGSSAQNSGATVTSAPQDNAATPSLFPTTMAPTTPFGSTQTPKNPFTFGEASGPPSSGSAISATPAKSPNVFNFGATTAASPSINPVTTPAEPSRPLGGFGFPSKGSQETKDDPKVAESGFNFLGASKPEAAKSTPAPSNNLFAGFGAKSTATQPNTPATSSLFGSVSSAPTQSSTSASAGFKFGPTSTGSAQSSMPTSSGLGFGATTSGPAPSSTPASSSKFGGFGASAPLPSTSTPTTASESSGKESAPEKASATTLFSKPAQGLFSTLSTPPANTGLQNEAGPKGAGPQNPFGGFKNSSPSTPQATSSTSLFTMPAEQPPVSLTPKSSTTKPAETTTTRTPSLFSKSTPMASQKPMPLFSPAKPATATSEEGQQMGTPKSGSLGASNRPGQGSVSSPLSPASAMPTLTGSAAPPETTAEASAPKVYVAQNWPASHGTSKDLAELSKQLTLINNSFRTKLANLSATADWSRLSRWHLNESTAIMRQITEVRKQAAAAKGITGNESSLSVKRKADEEGSRSMREGSPTKKQRPTEVPNTPTPKSASLFSTTPKAAPPASQTASLFGSAINKASPPTSEAPAKEAVTSKSSGLEIIDNAKNAEGTRTSLFGSTSQAPSKPGLFKSPFEMPKSHAASSTTKNGGKIDFMAQFGKASKTAEELRAERKAKDKDADFDSEDETEEEWSARWDKKEEERIAQQKEKLKEQTTVKPTTETPTTSIFKPTSGTSSPGLFGSRPASPALPNGAGTSVFDTPLGATTPNQSNIFGHLSSAPSSNNQDEDDDDEGEEDNESQHQPSADPDLTKRKLDQAESESDETLEEVLRNKRQDTAKKPALIDRITRADPSEVDTSESEKEGSKTSTSIFSSHVNGMQTPVPKAKHFFDFAAAGAQTAPPKQDTFGGDQTFKPGTPIKFGTATKGQPTFQFQPATPSTPELSTTPSKPPPTTFSFLNATNNQSGPASGVSTRAPTPLSEAESGRDSAVENEDEEGTTSEQLDLSGLTEEETAQYDILFSTPKAVAKHNVTKSGGEKVWEAFVNGPLWIVKHKETGRAIVRMRLLTGTMKLNYNILPKLNAVVAGKSRKMVSATGLKPDGKPTSYYFCLKSTEEAEEFARVYNENVP